MVVGQIKEYRNSLIQQGSGTGVGPADRPLRRDGLDFNLWGVFGLMLGSRRLRAQPVKPKKMFNRGWERGVKQLGGRFDVKTRVFFTRRQNVSLALCSPSGGGASTIRMSWEWKLEFYSFYPEECSNYRSAMLYSALHRQTTSKHLSLFWACRREEIWCRVDIRGERKDSKYSCNSSAVL